MTKNTSYIISFVACLLVMAVFAVVAPQNALAAYTCNSDSQCGASGFVGQQYCQGNSLFGDFVTYYCNNPGTNYSSCTSNKSRQIVRTCNSDQVCKDNLWFIGCASPYDNVGGTNNNSNYNNYNPYNSYNPNGGYNPYYNYNTNNSDYLRCSGNTVFWFDQYGNKKSIYQECAYNQTCQNNTCVTNTCTSHATKGCINGSVYWYNSCGTQQEMYQNCTGSGLTCQEGTCVASSGTSAPQPQISYIKVKTNENLTISLFGKKDAEAMSLRKELTLATSDVIDFVVVVKNTSDKALDNVMIKIDPTEKIANLSNIKIDATDSKENLINGINLGSLAKGASKVITFNGTVVTQNIQSGVKILGTVTAGKITDNDSLVVNVQSSTITANSTESKNTASVENSSLMTFIKKWYVWGILIIVLIFLFVIIFRRLSSNV